MDALGLSFKTNLQRARKFNYPFAMIVGETLLPWEYFRQCLRALPEDSQFRPMYHPDALRLDGTSTRAVFELSRNTAWSDLLSIFDDRTVCQVLLKALSGDLLKRFNCSEESLLEKRLYPRVAFVRDETGFKIRPHPDCPSKVITMQWYLARDRTQQGLGTTMYDGPSSAWATLNYLPNHFYAFAVSDRSWHGREMLPPLKSPRLTLSVTYYLEPSAGEFIYAQ